MQRGAFGWTLCWMPIGSFGLLFMCATLHPVHVSVKALVATRHRLRGTSFSERQAVAGWRALRGSPKSAGDRTTELRRGTRLRGTSGRPRNRPKVTGPQRRYLPSGYARRWTVLTAIAEVALRARGRGVVVGGAHSRSRMTWPVSA